MNFLGRSSKNAPIRNFFKICAVGAELFHADGHTDGLSHRHEEANSCSSQF